mgnify:CR=1 FL=1
MTIEFQKNLLKYFYQRSEAKDYITILENSIFDVPLYVAGFTLIKGYVTEFGRIPKKVTMLEYFDEQATKLNFNKDSYDDLHGFLDSCYDAFDIDEDYAKSKIIQFAKKQYTIKLFEDNADAIDKADDKFFTKLLSTMSKIVTLGSDTKDKYEGRYLLKDYGKARPKPIEGNPTYLNKLNKMTAARGFHKPQLIVIMGGPKGFKTGVTLNIVVNYVRDGFKVYFADGENSVDSIVNRAYQCMLGATREELSEGTYENELDQIVEKFKALGGDMRTDYFPAYISTLADVEEKLDELESEDGWTPDIIVYDYLDLFAPVDKSIKEKRLKIQDVYHHAIRINNKRQCFSFTPSQINKAAVGKNTINLTDFAEDFAKAHNCHAAFGIAGDDEMRALGYALLVPVAQREGSRFTGDNFCPLVIDESRMMVEYDEQYENRAKTYALSTPEERKEETKFTFKKKH